MIRNKENEDEKENRQEVRIKKTETRKEKEWKKTVWETERRYFFFTQPWRIQLYRKFLI